MFVCRWIYLSKYDLVNDFLTCGHFSIDFRDDTDETSSADGSLFNDSLHMQDMEANSRAGSP